MTFREELEILRGRPIVNRLPVDEIPCHEVSDLERLCRNPLVSVHMVTYNHEPYIRHAIESVLCQQTDFEFEIVIGEDCSSDKTREICFEYQRKCPEKIRVLWSEENVFRVCGNAARVTARCRGEYLAILECDDCWIDRHKLQKQVDVMRKNPSVGICIGHGVCHNVTTGEDFPWQGGALFPPGFMSGAEFMERVVFQSGRVKRGLAILTPSVMLRKSALQKARESFEIFNWSLITLDTLCWAGVSSVSDAYCLTDSIAQYNIVPGSASSNSSFNLEGDSAVVKVFFARIKAGREWRQIPPAHKYLFVVELIKHARSLPRNGQAELHARLMDNLEMKRLGRQLANYPVFLALKIGCINPLNSKWLLRLRYYAYRFLRW